MDRCNANVSGKLDTKIEDNRQCFRNTGEGWDRELPTYHSKCRNIYYDIVIIRKIFVHLSPTLPHALSAPNYFFFFFFSIMICRHVLTRNHHWLSIYKQGMLRNKKRVIDPKRLSLWRNKLNWLRYPNIHSREIETLHLFNGKCMGYCLK